MKRYIDLRSDTVTQPTPAMRQAMATAPVGDDVLGEDPTVIKLESMGAELFGKEACLFTCSGSMSNQIAVLTLAAPGSQVILHNRSHMYNLEVAGLARTCGVQGRPLSAPNGRFCSEELLDNIVPSTIQTAPTGLVCLENSFDLNRGLALPPAYINEVCELVHGHSIPVYLDGARLLNAAVALGVEPAEICHQVDMVSLCLSKGLGCPVGSLLAGPRELIEQARQMRQLLGGGWRQAGILAAAGIIALTDYSSLARDHERAKQLAVSLEKLGLGIDLAQVQTNIIKVGTEPVGLTAPQLAQRLLEQGVKAKVVGNYDLRMITHLGISDDDLDTVVRLVAECLSH